MRWEIVGHDWAVDLLQSHVQKDRVSHAYLFTGPRGIGRRTLALRFIQALMCPNSQPINTPCMECQICQNVWHLRHPDLHVIQRREGDRDIKIEAVRELQRSLALAPYTADLRAALFLNFDEASHSAANALLKTLEEPTARVVMILTAESSENLIPTVVSRCEVMLLRPVPLDDISDHLQSVWDVPPEQALSLAQFSGGRPGYAIQLHQNPDLFETHRQLLTDHYRLLSAKRVERLRYAQKISRDKQGFRHAILVWQTFWREILLCSLDQDATPLNNEWRDEIRALANKTGSKVASQTISALDRTINHIDRNVNPRLAAEALFLNLPFV
jgi:DNA polymerase-3 subunit delta'